jgi:hypothetical protein
MSQDLRPCGGDGWLARWLPCRPTCTNCAQWQCLGTDGYRWLALVASEVAGERAVQVRQLESKKRDLEWRMDAHAIGEHEARLALERHKSGALT